MQFSRRSFLHTVLAGSAVLAVPDASAAMAAPRPPSWRPLSDGRRQSLIQAAAFGTKTPVAGRRGVAITTHPLATWAAVEALRADGNAVDAACAASLLQTVVEPHMTSITGGFSMLYFEAATGETQYLNASSNVPLKLDGFDLTKLAAFLTDGRGVTVPGFWAGVDAAMDRYGRLPLKRVMAPAIHYARHGYEVHPFLWSQIFSAADRIGRSAMGREIYFPGGVLINPGGMVRHQRYADCLERLAEERSAYFYHGAFAREFSKTVQAAGGFITPDDFAAYQPLWTAPVRGRYRDHQVIAAPAPDFGGNAFVEILHMLDLVDIQTLGPVWQSPESGHLLYRIMGEVFTEAQRRNYGMSAHSHADMLAPETAERRLQSVRSSDTVRDFFREMMQQQKPPQGSTHLTVVDGAGNIATVLHSSMSMPWSNGLFAAGANISAAAGHYASGLPVPGARIHARILPNMLLKDGRPVLASGSPSVSLMEAVTQVTSHIIDFAQPVEDAVARPRIGGASMAQFGSSMVERDLGEDYIAYLRQKGMALEVMYGWHWNMGSFEGVHIAADGTARACGDPRRTAVAMAV